MLALSACFCPQTLRSQGGSRGKWISAALSESALPLFDYLEPCAAERVGSSSCGLEKLFRRFAVDELLIAVRVTSPAPVEEAAMKLENCFAGGVEPVHRGALYPSFFPVSTTRSLSIQMEAATPIVLSGKKVCSKAVLGASILSFGY